jgi:5-methylcytosine-specific restriction enzyme A
MGIKGPDRLPNGIKREHLLAGISDFRRGVEHDFRDSTTYDVLHEGRRYPPKVVVGLAAGHLLGKPLAPRDFRAGLGTKCFRVLEAGGLKIVGKAAAGAFPEELADEPFYEGAATTVKVNRFERDHEARKKCIRHYGTRCAACGFDFEAAYGALGEGFIHVHHIVPLADIRARYMVDPVKDLRPVCPNCHAMLHRRRPALSLVELKSLLTPERRPQTPLESKPKSIKIVSRRRRKTKGGVLPGKAWGSSESK